MERFLWPEREQMRTRAMLEEVVRRIVEIADPDQVILFGSAARNRMRTRSDFDILVVKAGVSDASQLVQDIHVHLFGISKPVDIIVATPEDLEETRGKMWTFLGRIQLHGRCIYRARNGHNGSGHNGNGRNGNGHANGYRYRGNGARPVARYR
jgi:predicted nucleotidyltransferase